MNKILPGSEAPLNERVFIWAPQLHQSKWLVGMRFKNKKYISERWKVWGYMGREHVVAHAGFMPVYFTQLSLQVPPLPEKLPPASPRSPAAS